MTESNIIQENMTVIQCWIFWACCIEFISHIAKLKMTNKQIKSRVKQLSDKHSADSADSW